MDKTDTQIVTVRLPIEIVERARKEAKEHYFTLSEFIRAALITVLDYNPDKHRHETLMYEIVKTRAVLIGFLDGYYPKDRLDSILGGAEADAKEYVQEHVGKEHAS
jgi:Arc/MetJ-type ribon-helix-helix transcriptional regulator